MRNFYVLIFVLFFGVSGAQIITFSDPAFKNALINTACATTSLAGFPVSADFNGDGEIDVDEAAGISGLLVPNNNISSLVELFYFTQLKGLNCSNNNLTSLDISTLTTLSNLNCSNNLLTSLNLSTISNLSEQITLNCSYNQLTSLDLKGNGYNSMNCSFNQLSYIDFSEALLYYQAFFENNNFSSLHLPSIPAFLNISNNPLTEFSFSGSNMYNFECENTLLETLDFSTVINFQLGMLRTIANNPNLKYINVKNGTMDGIDPDPEDPASWIIENNPLLERICIDGPEESFFAAVVDDPQVLFTNYCSFTPGGQYNTINGNVHLNCGSNEIGLGSINILVTETESNGMTLTGQYGNYNIFTGSGMVTVAPQLENSSYFNITPGSVSHNFLGFNNSEVFNFCITPNGVHRDLEIAIIATDAARPGFDATYKLICKNRGTETQSGTVNLNFQDAVLDFVSANPAPDAQSTDLLTWNFTNLAPFEIREITITLNVNSPMETPAVNNDDVLQFTASVNSQTDETPSDNTAILAQTVVGSFDPNDKMVAEGAFINPTQLGDYLHYTIRFQNTGTFAAQNVVIMDMLASNLDLGSLQIQSASHPYRAVLDSRKLEFFFENIQLPPVDENEPGSHGYVTFKIKPKNTVVVGNTIENKAEIYFDFNFPIVTNTVTTAVAPLGTKAFEKTLFTVYPNPATTVLNIVSDSKINTIEISNNLGQTVLKSQNPDSIDISGLAAGVYFIKAVAAKGYSTQKFIKL